MRARFDTQFDKIFVGEIFNYRSQFVNSILRDPTGEVCVEKDFNFPIRCHSRPFLVVGLHAR
jgi:hypothetical protein